MKKTAVFILALCAVLWTGRAGALAVCSVSAGGVAFGIYDPSAFSPLDRTGNVRVSCSLLGLAGLLVSYDILLSTGDSGSYAQRRMPGEGYALDYNLYTDNLRTKVWGDGSGSTSVVSDGYLLELLPQARDYPVYGRIPAGQNLPAGSYGDTITVTVNY